MSEQLSDAKIDELLDALDIFAHTKTRSIVRAWLPAQTCPKRVRVTKAGQKMGWYNRRIGEVFSVWKLEIQPDGNGTYWVHADGQWRWVDIADCEPAVDEGGE